VSDSGTAGACIDGVALGSVRSLVVTPDGRNVYAVSNISDAIAAFAAAGLAYDIDGDGELESLTDGLLVLRFLFGFTGAPLVTGAVDAVNCTRCTAPAIEAYLQALSGE
jgi:hypothetical protein